MNKTKIYVVISDDDDVANGLARNIKGRGHTVRTARMISEGSGNEIIFVTRTDIYETWTLARFCDGAELAFFIAVKKGMTEAALSHLRFLNDRGIETVAVLGVSGRRAVDMALVLVPEYCERLITNDAEGQTGGDRIAVLGGPVSREETAFGQPFFKRGHAGPNAVAKTMVEPIDDACGTAHPSPAGTSPLDLLL